MKVRSLVAAVFVLCAWGVSDVLLAESTAPARTAASRPDYGLAVWAADKGQPPGDVFAIAQDTEGYLWLGTPNGLHRFDGARFQPWSGSTPATALPSGPI